MGKLLGQIFKEDLKSIILWFVLPPIALASFMTMLFKLGDNPILQIASGIAMMLVFIGPAIALIQIVVNDWQRFYGKNASFYSAIPISTGKVTAARLINYILMGMIAAIVAIFNVLALGMISSEEVIRPSDFFEMVNFLIEHFGGKLFFVILIYIFVLGVQSVSQVLFSNAVASTKGMHKLGNLGPILSYIITNLVISFIFGRVQVAVSGDYIVSNMQNSQLDISVVSNPPYQALLIPILVNILLIAILVGSSYYIQKRKLSVA